jgi:Domain of unknown function (DUF4365)
MTSNDIMEAISKDYILAIAHNNGFINFQGRDYGTDLTIRKAVPRTTEGRNRYLTSGKAIDVQLKAISEDGLSFQEQIVKFKLKTKNFNDLVERSQDNGHLIPLILVVFVLPSDRTKWVECIEDGLVIRRAAYWYQVLPNTPFSNNAESVTIDIPIVNKVNTQFFSNLFNQLWQ